MECNCGSTTWQVLGNWFEHTTYFAGPLVAACCQCSTRLRIIDTLREAMTLGEGLDEDATVNDVWCCIECGMAEGHLMTAFGYQYEPEPEGTEDRHDMFDSFILMHQCVEAGKKVNVTFFECA